MTEKEKWDKRVGKRRQEFANDFAIAILCTCGYTAKEAEEILKTKEKNENYH